MNPLKDLHILDTGKLFILVISLVPQPVNLLPKFHFALVSLGHEA
jgi:hypothetical protein